MAPDGPERARTSYPPLEDVLNRSFDDNGGVALRNVHRVDASLRADLITFLKSIDATTPIFP